MKLPWWLPIGPAPGVSAVELKHWIDEGRRLQFIDARTAVEFQQGTLGQASHAPVTGMPGSIDALPLDPSVPVVVLCLSGHRSLPGARWLRRKGFQAYSLEGGFMAWKRAGYDLDRS